MPLAPSAHPPLAPSRPPTATPETIAGAAVPVPVASAPLATPASNVRPFNALPGLVGYGLLVLFALDVAQILAAYRPFRPEEDQMLILQVIERIAVPLVAYVMIFWAEPPAPSRFELRVRKLLSIASIGFALVCLGLAAMAVSSGMRLNGQARAAAEKEARERTAGLERLARDLPTMSAERVQATYFELARRGAGQVRSDLTAEQMRELIATAVPQALESSRTLAAESTAQARRVQMIVSAKYCIGGLIAAVLFFLIWEATGTAREFVIFSRRGDSTLTVEERMERFLDSFRFIPDFEEYRWYRRMRREWRLWRQKRAAAREQSWKA